MNEAGVSLYRIEHYLFRLKNDLAMQAELAGDPAAHLARQDLDDAAREALLAKDVATLWRMGVHPLLLLPYSRFVKLAPREYHSLLQPLAGERKFCS